MSGTIVASSSRAALHAQQIGRQALEPRGRHGFFSFLKRKSDPPPALPLDSLFHPLSASPSPALREKADRIRATSLCPVSYEKYHERLRPAFDCPDCGWPTHASRERWLEGRDEHTEYCGRLREVNEDEHDIRSGRKMAEFEDMPRKTIE